MPVDVAPAIGDPQPCDLAEAEEALADLRFDPLDEGKVREAARWLTRLIANRNFLAELLLDRLAGRKNARIESDYGPQAIVLSPVRGGVFLRANIWPAANDLCVQASGAHNFVYGTPHDHNFSFLTGGYCGPGYLSEHYEYDYSKVVGYPGEPVDLRYVGRSILAEGAIQIYRAHRDVHVQHPPESLSVSLNVMEVAAAQGWLDQYGFDLERREVSRQLSSSATEVFLRAAVASGSGNAMEFAEWVGRTHPSERLRLASFEARAGAAGSSDEREAIWQQGEGSGSRMVAAIARRRQTSGAP